jgi:hypothetical protein
MDSLANIIPGTIAGFSALNILTHQKSPIWKKMMHKKYPRSKRIQLYPSIRLQMKNRIFHLHHWMTLSIVLGLSLMFKVGILDHALTQGFLIGGIIQGLSDPMSRKVVYPLKPSSNSWHHSF